MSQIDRAKKKASATTSDGWGRHRMNETHRKGRLKAKLQRARALRRLGVALVKEPGDA